MPKSNKDERELEKSIGDGEWQSVPDAAARATWPSVAALDVDQELLLLANQGSFRAVHPDLALPRAGSTPFRRALGDARPGARRVLAPVALFLLTRELAQAPEEHAHPDSHKE